MEMKQLGVLEEEAFFPTVIPGIKCIKLSAPIAAQYEISGGCNQSCVFCYNVWKGDDHRATTLPPKERLQIIEKLINLGVFEVILSGGEPLLIPEICEIVNKLARENIKTYLITNGLLMTESLAYRLRASGLDSIQISLHGSSYITHDPIVQNPGSFVKTMMGIKNAIRAFTPDAVNVNMVLVEQNRKDVGALIRTLSVVGVKQFSLGFLSKTGAALTSDVGIKKNQLLESFREAMSVGQEVGIGVGVSGGFPICIFPPEERTEVIHLSVNLCDAGLNQIVISPNGDIRSCVCLPHILGNILEYDPREVWKSSSFLHFLQRFEHVPPKCYDCSLVAMCKGGCRAAAYSVYGNFQAIDPVVAEGDNREHEQY